MDLLAQVINIRYELGPPYNKKPPNKKFRRSGGLSTCTHHVGRSMTLRPRLATGLPFRGSESNSNEGHLD